MPRAVILRHDLPDGSWHYDWMIERSIPDLEPRPGPGPERRLLTFRLDPAPAPPPADPAAGPFQADRLPDHRAHYLDHEGPVSGGRGTVTRVASGPGEVLRDSPEGAVIACTFAGLARRFRARPDAPSGRWRVEPEPMPDAGDPASGPP